jgi:hypothetical protein
MDMLPQQARCVVAMFNPGTFIATISIPSRNEHVKTRLTAQLVLLVPNNAFASALNHFQCDITDVQHIFYHLI